MKKLLLFITIIVTSACSTYQVVDIDILQPSELQLNPQIQSVAILNNSPEQATDVGHTTYSQVYKYGRQARKKKISNDDIKVDSITKHAIDIMKENLMNSMLFSSVEIGRYEDTPKVYLGNINQTFDLYPVDALVVLASLQYQENYSQIYYEYYDKTEEEVEVVIESKWFVYSAMSYIQPVKFSSRDTFYWNLPEVDRAECVKIAAWENAKEAAQQITPYWISVNRLYYAGSSFVYSKIDEFIKVQNWEEAAKLWMEIYNGENKDSSKKARMAFNMALFFEMKTDIESAQMWLNTAIDIFSKKNAESDVEMCQLYQKVLKNRLINQEKLNMQFMH